MIGLGGACNASPGQKSPPKKGGLAAILLHHRQIDMQGQGVLRAEAEGLHDLCDLLLGADREHLLAGAPLLRTGVEGQAKGLPKELRQQPGKVLTLGNDLDAVL